jgi:hypothetical protein
MDGMVNLLPSEIPKKVQTIKDFDTFTFFPSTLKQ